MPYVPPNVVEDTCFPTVGGAEASSKDFCALSELLKEKYETFYPQIDYYTLAYTPTKATDPGDISGLIGETQADDLWGEDVPIQVTDDWVQPHSISADGLLADAADCKIYHDPIPFNVQVTRTATDYTLKKFGIDQMRELLITCLVTILDENNIKMRIGDKFLFDGEYYEVEEIKPNGYWLNTNVHLYMIGNCKRLRLGS